jgi:DNA recombination protein RmuC
MTYLMITANVLLAIVLILLIRQIFVNSPQQAIKSVKEEISQTREEYATIARLGREEGIYNLNQYQEAVIKRIHEMSDGQLKQLDLFSKRLTELTQSNETRLDKQRAILDKQLLGLQEKTEKKLDEIRLTVDERLHSTLEKRLGESFKLVSERLEIVHKGLGEMQNLANGVGDLKNVLTNVKVRGTWGEAQLANLLEQYLSPGQYKRNFKVRKNGKHVEFAIKLPGREENQDSIYLAVDSKFPQEDHVRLMDAQEKADASLVEECSKELEKRIIASARDISSKYIAPPATVNFAIMFLPTESLYAEVLRRPGLAEKIQRDYRVVISGPTTFAALLNSLQIGFRTLAVEKHSAQIWKVLGAVKTEFNSFGELLDKVYKKIQETGNSIKSASSKSRNIESKLRKVEALPVSESNGLLEIDNDEAILSENQGVTGEIN